jgi:predicted RNA-binding protein with PUA-like domain
MNYWIFKANPEHYRIDDRMLDSKPDIIWAVTRYHERIQKGDTVFIWRAGTPRGICAVMQVEQCPYQPLDTEIHDGFELASANPSPVPPHWAKCRILQRFPTIDASIIKKIPGLELFSFFSAFQQATNFSVLRPEGTILMEFIEEHKADIQVKKRESVAKPAPKAAKTSPVRQVNTKKTSPAAPSNGTPAIALLKCAACGRYVVSSDTDRHVREARDGQQVTWKKTK